MFKANKQARRAITVGGTLFCAWAIGFLMQSNAQEAVSQNQDATVPDVNVEPLVHNEEAPLAISDITLTSALMLPSSPQPEPDFLPDAPIVLASIEKDTPIINLPREEAAPTFACENNVTATPAAAAMVTLEIDAPCLPNDRFTVHHNGMMFTDVTDDSGKRVLSVPALAADAVYIVSFSGGEGAVAATSVTSMELYDRVVVQWTGQTGLQIHALEYGAAYDQAGHVWMGDARDSAHAARGEGGFMARYGLPGDAHAKLAEVYSFPSGTIARAGDVALSLEAEVTRANCGRDIEAQTLQTGPDGRLKVQEIMLSVPDCNAVGDFLVLKNLLNDLKIARN